MGAGAERIAAAHERQFINRPPHGAAMQRVVLELVLAPEFEEQQRRFFERVESLEFLELLRLDLEQGLKLFIADITLEEGASLEDLGLEQLQVMSVLKVDGRRHTCLVKGVAPRDMLGFYREYDMDLLFDLPTQMTRDRNVMTVVGEQSEVRRFMRLMERLGTVRVVSSRPAAFHDRDVLDLLTPRQREVLSAAMRGGYYHVP